MGASTHRLHSALPTLGVLQEYNMYLSHILTPYNLTAVVTLRIPSHFVSRYAMRPNDETNKTCIAVACPSILSIAFFA
jgi:hypothetical protein